MNYKKAMPFILVLVLWQLPLYSTTWVAGGKGDMTGASDTNGGGYEGSRTWDDFQGANGGAKYTVIECDYNDGTGVITKAGQFAVNLDDLWVNVKEGAAGGWVEKRYKITASTADTITVTAGEGANANVDVWVGGAFDDTKAGIDAGLAEMVGGDTLMIATNPASQKNIDCAATITIPAALAGTSSANCIIKGVDYADGGDLSISEQIPKLTGTASLANGVLYFGNAANIYFTVENIEIDAGGVGKADFCIKALITNFSTFKNCILHNALDNAAFYSDGDGHAFVGCELYGSGYGIRYGLNDGRIVCFYGNSFHDNTNDGVYIDDTSAVIIGNLFYDNGGRGLFLKGGNFSYGVACIFDNTFYANDGHNIQMETSVLTIMINNTMSGSTGGYGLQLDTDGYFMHFSNNNSYNNFSGHCNKAVADGAWDVYLDGGNDHSNPTFEGSDADGDFRPADGSVLLGIGYPDYFPFGGDRDNLQNYGHIGAVTRDEPAGGGGSTTNIFINDRSGGKN